MRVREREREKEVIERSRKIKKMKIKKTTTNDNDDGDEEEGMIKRKMCTKLLDSKCGRRKINQHHLFILFRVGTASLAGMHPRVLLQCILPAKRL